MAQATYKVILSTDSKHTVIVTSDYPAAIKAAGAWAKATYEAIVERYGVKQDPRFPRRGQASDAEPATDEEKTPICQGHGVPMVRVNGKRGRFGAAIRRIWTAAGAPIKLRLVTANCNWNPPIV